MRRDRTRLRVFVLVAGAVLILNRAAIARAQPIENYTLPYRFLGDCPSDTSSPGFSNNIQGIATDGAYWYITQTSWLWKFPFHMDWSDVHWGGEDVSVVPLSAYVDGPPYVIEEFVHMGDLDVHYACGEALLIVPLHDDDTGHPAALLIVRAVDLGGAAWSELDPGSHNLAGWCAVDPGGLIYTAGSQSTTVKRYALACDGLSLSLDAEITLLDENANPFADGVLDHKQGATFSPTGDQFVLANGYESDPVLGGLHIFDTTNWRRVAHSTNGGTSLFNFTWDPGDGEEPEGVVWYDFDQFSPGLCFSGELHVLLLNNSFPDTIFFKHYTSRIYVSATAPCLGGVGGSYFCPYPTVSQAASLAWNGSEMRISAGSYDEAVTISARTRLVAIGGTVRIGD